MKASGKSNEITIDLEAGEISSILSRDLTGVLSVHDYRDQGIQVSFSIFSLFDTGGITVVTEPLNSYLPQAENIAIYLWMDSYSKLMENGLCGTRFGGGGKITIRDKNIDSVSLVEYETQL